tara:strand:+ start:6682 stop:7917 length:1236 start_codon:yes stop_codon:yes gene_type:complete
MSQGKRLHLSYERVVLLADSAPAFRAQDTVHNPTLISRVQDISYSFNFNPLQLKEIGSSEYIKDRTPAVGAVAMKSRIPILSQPTVDVQFSYLFFDAANESALGFNVDGGYLFENSKLYNKPDWANLGASAEAKKGDINLYLLAEQANPRKDILGRQDKTDNSEFDKLDLIGIGNCYLSSYGISAQLGSMVSCQLSYSCSNICIDEYNFNHLNDFVPAVNNKGERSTSIVQIHKSILRNGALDTDNSESSLALRPGDIEITWTDNKADSEGGFSLIDIDPELMLIQSIQVSLDINRQDINCFGSDYIKDRKIQFPILGSMSANIILRDIQKNANKSEISQIFKDDVSMDIEIKLYSRTSATSKKHYATVKIPDAKLASESHSMSIGGFAEVSAEFLFEIGTNSGMQIIKHV